MPYSVNIRSDDASSANIRLLWDRCALLEPAASMRSLQYPPHITFAIYDDISREVLVNAFDTAVEGVPPLTVRFDSLGYFDAPHAIVLWAKPALPPEFADFHRRIHSFIDVESCRQNYRPGVWIPHCTLATAVDHCRREEAIALVSQKIEAFEVKFDVADCAYFKPVEVIHEKALSKIA